MNRSLKGKVALITGATGRTARSIVQTLAEAGAHVALHFHSARAVAEELHLALEQKGHPSMVLQADFQKDEEIQRLVDSFAAKWGRVDVVVNAAAIFERASVAETSLDLLQRHWEVNVRAAFRVTQHCLRWMKEGDVINLLDIGGTRQAWPNAAAYCMSKAAMQAMTECLAVELAPHIRVNAVALGLIGAPSQVAPNQWEKLQNRIPLKRFGRPEEVAEAVLFLLTGPSFVTGHTLVLDGGRSLNVQGNEG